MADEENSLGLFLDVNVLIDAFVFQHGDDQPVEFSSLNFTYKGDPASVVMMLIDSRDPLKKNTRLSLHTSQRVIQLVMAILAEQYRWKPEAVKLAGMKIISMTKKSGGTLCRDKHLPINFDETEDKEDAHRMAEARRCGADLVLTRDRDLLDQGITNPSVITPRKFIQWAI